MSRQTKIILIIAGVVLIAAIVFMYFYFQTGTPSAGNNFPSSGNISNGNGNGTGTGVSGNTVPNQNTGTGANGTFPTGQTSQTALALRKIADGPIAGAIIFDSASTTKIRYVDRGTGNVFETSVSDTSNTRITNTTIAKIYEAIFSPNGNSFIGRYLKSDDETITSFFGNIKPAVGGGAGEVSASFMPSKILQTAISPSGSKVFYLVPQGVGVSGVLGNTDGSGKIQIFSSPLKEFLVSWAKEDTIAITTKASVISSGYSYLLNSNTEKLTKILSGFMGLTALYNNNLSYGLFSESSNNNFGLNVIKLKDNSTTPATIKTLPEKCVWSKNNPVVAYCAVPSFVLDGDYPDAWYQGVVSFSDDIWKLNADTGASTFVTSLKNGDISDFDGINLTLSKNDNYLLFTNKQDLSLWLLKLTNN